jgi:hypothetical protein
MDEAGVRRLDGLDCAASDAFKPGRIIMIQRDYILRMIEEFRRVVEAIMAYRSESRWEEVVGTVDEQFRRLIGVSALEAGNLPRSELDTGLTELRARRAARSR